MDRNLVLEAKNEAIERELERLLPSDTSLLSAAKRFMVFSGGKKSSPLSNF